MASLIRSANMVGEVMVAVAAILLLSSSSTLVSGQTGCLDEYTPLVYPQWSICYNPARYYGEEVYEIQAGAGGGRLAPEWDEGNSTYYVRVAEEGAKYVFTHITKEYRPYVAQSHNVLVVNLETGRLLSWRAEGEDEYFLVEEESGNANLQFAVAGSLPCPRIAGARCNSYFLLDSSNTSRGLSPYVEDDVTYFTLGTQTSSLVLLRSSSSSSSSSTTLKSVVA